MITQHLLQRWAMALATGFLVILAGCNSAPRSPRAESSQEQTIITLKPPPANVTDAEKIAAAHIIEDFSAPCIESFPDDAAVEAFASEQKLAPMPESEVRRLLGRDPGEGWIGRGQSGIYTLTIEKPPFHTCAVRVPFTGSPDAVIGQYSFVVSLWAATEHDNMASQPPISVEIAGHPTVAYVYELTDLGGKPLGRFMLFVTSMLDGTYELRLLRQMEAG
jgi:hypothetical protein